MGYSDLTLSGSDEAAELAGSIESCMVKILEKELKMTTNEYNTDGIINVAMFFDECIIPCKYWGISAYDDGLIRLAEKTAKKLKKRIDDTVKDDWDDKANKRMHLTAYRRLLRRLRKFLADWDRLN